MPTKVLGDYAIIKQIGQGTLGAVYLAEHRFMKKQYTLKVLPAELSADRAFIQRFEEGVGELTALDHPHIVKIHTVSFAEGQYFLVTDCIVDGNGETTNLGQYLLERERPLNEQEIFHALLQIANALDYAHGLKSGSAAMAHRGLKMNNILISQCGKELNLHLSDFGLSRLIGTGRVLSKTCQLIVEAMGDGDNKKQASAQAAFLHNFAFLAPEQRRSDYKGAVASQADAYAFGVLAYYLLMGQFPEGYFPLPSTSPAQYVMDWDPLIRSALATDPNGRPEELVAALHAVSGAAVIHPTAEALMVQTHREPAHAGEGSAKLRPLICDPRLERPEYDLDPAKALEVDPVVKHYTPETHEERHIEPIRSEMVVIPGGTFYRGCNGGNRDEMPKHPVSIRSFAIDIHPVTNEQFVRFLEAMGGEKDNHHRDIIRLRDARIKRSGGKLSVESGYLKHPVVGVTWYGAVAYARWVGKRLPTEAEWEIAASGGSEGALYPTGGDLEKSQANFFSSDTTPVMSYPSGFFGLFDMAGNVYEWCQDWYGYSYYETSLQEPENPKGPLQGVYRVLRGGCWKSLKEDLRSSRRHRNNPGTVNGTYGFRCAADVTDIL